jgi:NADH:ubiquinone oxidoreductase subunit
MGEKLSTAYNELAKKYGLPSYRELDREFCLHDEEKNHYVLRQVLQKIFEKYDFFTKLLDETLHPDSNLSGLVESKSFTEEQKDRFFETYKKLMRVNRHSIRAYALSTEEAEAESIRVAWEAWISIKNDLQQIAKLLSEAWQKDESDKDRLTYMG